jgi:hypothetical protein
MSKAEKCGRNKIEIKEMKRKERKSRRALTLKYVENSDRINEKEKVSRANYSLVNRVTFLSYSYRD